MQRAVFDHKTNFYKEIKRQMNISSYTANASARHGIDSKLKTMRMRITENPAGVGGGCLILYFQ